MSFFFWPWWHYDCGLLVKKRHLLCAYIELNTCTISFKFLKFDVDSCKGWIWTLVLAKKKTKKFVFEIEFLLYLVVEIYFLKTLQWCIVYIGAHTSAGSIWTIAMLKRRFVNWGGAAEAPNLWPKQARRKEGNIHNNFVSIFLYFFISFKINKLIN